MKEERSLPVWVAAAVSCLCIAQSAFAGSIVAWGSIAFDTGRRDANDFIAIAAGSGHSLALKSDGSIVGWGRNWPGQATPPEGGDFVAIAAGYEHSLALKSGGSIVAWGYNRDGQATPPDGNDFIAMLKDSSLATVLAVSELTQLTRIRRSSTFRVMEAFNVAAFLYLSLTLILSAAVRGLEKRMKIIE